MKKKSLWPLITLITVVGIIFLAILLPTLIKIVPEIWAILQHRSSEELEVYLKSFGWIGAIIIFVLQFLQTLVPIFPAILIQVASGVIFGAFLGTLIVTAANGLANFLVFIFLRRYGQKFLDKLWHLNFLRQFKVYFDSKNPTTVVFIFFMLPFLTNAAVPYMAATTTISKKNFLFAMVSSTLPMTFLSVYLGDSLVRGEWQRAIVVTGLMLILSLGLFFSKNTILKLLGKTKK